MATLNSLLSKFGLKVLKLNAGFMQMEFESSNATRQAAWELYVELLTRVATQALEDGEGDEDRAKCPSNHSQYRSARAFLGKLRGADGSLVTVQGVG